MTGNVMVAWGEGAEAAAVACRMLEVAPPAFPDSRDACRTRRRSRELLAAVATNSDAKLSQVGSGEARALTALDGIMTKEGGVAVVRDTELGAELAISNAD